MMDDMSYGEKDNQVITIMNRGKLELEFEFM
jgi:hypothetical protein